MNESQKEQELIEVFDEDDGVHGIGEIKFYHTKIKKHIELDENYIIKYRHCQVNQFESIRAFTLCGIYNKEKKIITYGLAICAPSDQFNKIVGREMAYLRAIETPIIIEYLKNLMVGVTKESDELSIMAKRFTSTYYTLPYIIYSYCK